MPLTAKGKKILADMREQYGGEKGESVFYAAANKGIITGVHKNKKNRRLAKSMVHKYKNR